MSTEQFWEFCQMNRELWIERDRQNRHVYSYRPNQSVTCLENLAQLSVEPELPGFILNLSKIG